MTLFFSAGCQMKKAPNSELAGRVELLAPLQVEEFKVEILLELENISPSKAVELSYMYAPSENLMLYVTDSSGRQICKFRYRSLISTYIERKSLILAPGEKYKETVSIYSCLEEARDRISRAQICTVEAFYTHGTEEIQLDGFQVRLTPRTVNDP